MKEFSGDQRVVATRLFFNEQLSCRVVLFLLTTFAVTAKSLSTERPLPLTISWDIRNPSSFHYGRLRVRVMDLTFPTHRV